MQTAVIALVRNREGIAGRAESDPAGIAETQASYCMENTGSNGLTFFRAKVVLVDAPLHSGQSLQIIFSKAVFGLQAAELSCEVLILWTVLGLTSKQFPGLNCIKSGLFSFARHSAAKALSCSVSSFTAKTKEGVEAICRFTSK